MIKIICSAVSATLPSCLVQRKKRNSVNTLKKQVSTASMGNLKYYFLMGTVCKYTRIHELSLFENT